MTIAPVYDPRTATEFLSCNDPPCVPERELPDVSLGETVFYLESFPMVREGVVTKLFPFGCEVERDGIKTGGLCMADLFPQTIQGRQRLERAINAAIFTLECQKRRLKGEAT